MEINYALVIAALSLVTVIGAVILGVIRSLYRKVRCIMAKFEDVDVKLDDILVGVNELAQLIGELRANGGGVISQAQLDALDEKAEQIKLAVEKAKGV